jgi:LacI family transcriptional regulator, galactose operon repressor
MRVTIKDIAEKAKISYPSVSRALSGKPGVSRKTREKVLKIAKEMNYQPNALARSLVQNRTSTIGLIIPDILNPYFPEIAKGVEDEAHSKDLSVFLCNSDWDGVREGEYINQLIANRVDGIIIFPTSSGNISEIRRKAGRNLPVVILGASLAEDVSVSISIDNVLGAELSVVHLLNRNYRKLAFIGGKAGLSSVEDRLNGFKKAHEKFGLTVQDEMIVKSGFTFESGYTSMNNLLDQKRKPDAVFAENDVIALGVIQALRTRGLKVPEDIAVSGFDDIPMASMAGIDLTTVRQPKYEMGKMAVSELYSILQGESDLNVNKRLVLEPKLIVRKTS